MNNSTEIWAAVAIIFCKRSSGREVLLIERANDPKDPWSGHLSFPGGKLETGETALAASMRECEEEVGLILNSQQLVRELPVGFAGATKGLNKSVRPFVFEIDGVPELALQESEIQSAIWLPESSFLNLRLHENRRGLNSSNLQEAFPCFPVGQKVLWGFSYWALKTALRMP